MAEEKREPFKARLAYVQKNAKAPKSNFNSFGKYKYRSTEDILGGVKDLCVNNGLLLTLNTEPHLETENPWIDVTARVEDVYSDESVESRQSAYVDTTKKGMSRDQMVGSATSYARKYALGGLFLIDDTKDADTDEYHQQTNRSATQNDSNTKEDSSTANEPEAGDEPITAQEAKTVEGMLLPNQKKYFLKRYKVDSIAKINKRQYTEVMNALKKREEDLENQSKA